MTRLALDTEAAGVALGQLGSVQDAHDSVTARLRTFHPGLFPPAVFMHVLAEQAVVSGGLSAGSAVIGRHRTELAIRTAHFIQAGGAASEQTMLALNQALHDAAGAGASAWDFVTAPEWEPLTYLYGGLGAVYLVASNSPLSTLNRFDVSIVKIANNPLFRRANPVLGLIGAGANAQNAWEMSSGRSGVGRTIIVGGSLGADALLYRFPAAAGADIITGGALRADLAAITNMSVYGVEGAWDGAMQAARDSRNEDLPGFAFDVISGTAGGALDGANQGLNDWDKAVGEGKFGGFMKGFRDVENDVIDWLYGNG